MPGNTATRRLYVELSAPLIDREIAKFRRAEAGALSYMQGEIRITARPPSPLAAIRSAISDEALVRPSFAGTRTINLEASMGGYHTFEIAGESWILSSGSGPRFGPARGSSTTRRGSAEPAAWCSTPPDRSRRSRSRTNA
jgi:hypothetical protein